MIHKRSTALEQSVKEFYWMAKTSNSDVDQDTSYFWIMRQ